MCVITSAICTARFCIFRSCFVHNGCFFPSPWTLAGARFAPYVLASSFIQRRLLFRVVIFIFITYSHYGQGKFPFEPYLHRALGVAPRAPPKDDAAVLCPVRALKVFMELLVDPSFVNMERNCYYHWITLVLFLFRCGSFRFPYLFHQLRSTFASLDYLSRTPLA